MLGYTLGEDDVQLHLTVSSDGVISLWDTKHQAVQAAAECGWGLATIWLDPREVAKIKDAQHHAAKDIYLKAKP